MGVTIHDVALRAGVSISTVSRVLNKTTPVSEEKRRRVEEAVAALGYTPNPAARSLLKQETGGLGVLLPYVSGEFFSDFLNGIDQATQENGYFLLISAAHRSPDEFMTALNGLNKRVDGLLIMATEMGAETLLDAVPDVPVVFVNTKVESEDIDVINFDNFGGVYRMTTHLLERGHRRIAVIKGPERSNDARERLRGYRAALEAQGVEHDPSLEIEGDYSLEAGYEATAAVLALTPRPTALIAANDYCAMGVLHALREAEIKVPDDMAVAGFDDVSSARYTTPPLSTVHVPIQELGRLAIERLVSKIQGKDSQAAEQRRLPVSLVIRKST